MATAISSAVPKTAIDDTPPTVAELSAELSDFAQACLDRAKELGIDGVELSLSDSRSVDVNCRCQKLESVDFSGDFSAAIRVLHQQRQATAAISERSLPALLRALENACDISRFTEPDPLYGMPDPETMCPAGEVKDLGLYQPYDIDLGKLEAMVMECEQAGFDSDKRISNSEGAGISSSQSVSVFANSLGVILSRAESSHNLGVYLLASEGDSSESGYYYTRAHSLDGLESPGRVGVEGAQRTVARLHPRKPATAACPVIYSAEVAGSFLGHLLEANDGSSIKRGDSFLIDQIGKAVAAPLLTLRERPLIPGGIASRCYDSEGVRTTEKAFVEAGRLLSHSLDSYHARYLKQKTTGNCGGVTNIDVDCSDLSEDDLVKQAGTGLLITDLIGFGVNTTTGDYSRGATGFWFENGEIQHPANECTVAGRLQDAYAAIAAIASNRWPHHNISTGSILVGQMMVGGVG